jgi:nitric oxide reductase NorD protein
VLEKLFGRISDWNRKREDERRSGRAAEFESLFPSLVAFAQGAVTHRGVAFQLKEYDGFGAIYGDTLLLPKRVNAFEDPDLNRRALLHKALAGGVLREGGVLSVLSGHSPVRRALQVAVLRGWVRARASELFPEYARWSSALETEVARALDGPELSEVDRAWLRLEARLGRELAEESERLARGEALSEDRIAALERGLTPQLIRELDEMPAAALALWCEPGLRRTELEDPASGKKDRKRDASPESEREGRAASEIEVVDLEKEKKNDNPVTHSFEKLETADEYQGGYKGADGADEMAEHANALEELDMRKVTRGGESASSSYRADISDLVHTKEAAAAAAKPLPFREYPEWDFAERKLKPRHCRLYLERPEVPSGERGRRWLEETLVRNAGGLEDWKHRLSTLVNERRVRDRQWEGSEISVDAFVRYITDTKGLGAGDPRLYLKSFPGIRDFSCLVLVDQSYSTDSWVMNRRVLDVELESVALVSQLLEPLREPVAVAGTWSETRNHCHFRLYKGFEDPWSRLIDHAPTIEPQGYTRLGPSIRHSVELLAGHGGRQKLLILLTDGKPTDYDRYEGRYGIEDIRHACLEAKQRGVTVRALTVEKEAKSYFPYLFGPGDYQILQNPEELPERLFRIYLESLRR